MTLADAMLQQIRAGRQPSPDAFEELLAADGRAAGSSSADALRNSLDRDVLGLGPLSELTRDPQVTDVLVNGTRGVWVDRGDGPEPAEVRLDDADAVRRLAVRLATLAGRRLDDASPCVDGLLPGGVRLHAVLPPLVSGAAHISLRVPAGCGWSLDDLVDSGSFSAEDAALLRRIVRSRVAFVVSGGTGSGKTTLLGAMLRECDARERILLIEDVRELSVEHPHVVGLEARTANIEGHGAVPMAVLVRQALRMRPDRIVVGEVRGAEVRELLAALNTGHEGGCGTVHANSPVDVIARFEALGALGEMSPQAVRTQLGSALDVVVHVRRQGALRVLSEIGLLQRHAGEVSVLPAMTRGVSGLQPAGGYEELLRLIEVGS